MEEVKKEGRTPLVVDSGNLFSNQNLLPENMKPQMRLKADLIAASYKKIGIDALNVGEMDLAFGVNYLLEKKKSVGLPLISSNLVYSDRNKPVFEPYVIKKKDGVKVAVFGLIPLIPSQNLKDNIKVAPPLEAAREIVEKLKKKADIVILLSNLGQPEDEKLAKEISGIDLIVGGRTRALLQTPVKADKTLIVQAMAQGKYIGRLELDPVTKEASNSVTPMDDKIFKNQRIEEMVKKYKDSVPGLNTANNVEKPQVKPVEPFLKTFIGENSCAKCHPRQTTFWKETKHAKAYETLVKNNSRMDLECVGCHTTGYGTHGGFRIGLEDPDLKGVQCESCHGPGNKHKGKGDIRRIIESTICMRCHDKEKSPKFDFTSYIEKVKCPK